MPPKQRTQKPKVTKPKVTKPKIDKSKYYEFGSVTVEIPRNLVYIKHLKKGDKEYTVSPMTQIDRELGEKGNLRSKKIDGEKKRSIVFKANDKISKPKILKGELSKKFGEIEIEVPPKMILIKENKNGKELVSLKDVITKTGALTRVKNRGLSFRIKPGNYNKVRVKHDDDDVEADEEYEYTTSAWLPGMTIKKSKTKEDDKKIRELEEEVEGYRSYIKNGFILNNKDEDFDESGTRSVMINVKRYNDSLKKLLALDSSYGSKYKILKPDLKFLRKNKALDVMSWKRKLVPSVIQ